MIGVLYFGEYALGVTLVAPPPPVLPGVTGSLTAVPPGMIVKIGVVS